MPFGQVTPYNQGSELSYLFGGSPLFPQQQFHQFNPWQGMSNNPMLNMALSMSGSTIAGMTGGVPMGFNGGNPNNNMRMMQQTHLYRQALRDAAASDMAPAMDFVRGFSALVDTQMGRPISWSPERATEAEKALRWSMQTIAPVRPDLFDYPTGGRSGIAMTAPLFMGTRNMRDPLTGRRGYGREALNELRDELFEGFGYADPTNPQAWRTRTKGFTAGQMGGLFEEMSRRGMVEAPGRSEDGGIDVTKVKKKMEEYTGALSAVREIFGDQGPFKDLYNALETVTQGAVYQLDPNRTEMAIRNFAHAASASGIGMDQALRMAGSAGGLAQQLGLVSGPWAMDAATSSMAFVQGGFGGVYSTPGWGRASPEQLTGMRQQMAVRNAASPYMNSLGALARIKELYGGNSYINNLLAQATAGGAPSDLVDLEKGEIIEKVAKASGRSVSEIEEIFSQKTSNEEYAYEGNFGRSAMAASREELVKLVMGSEGGSAYNEFARSVQDRLGGAAGSEAVTKALARTYRDAFVNSEADGGMSDAARSNRKTRNANLQARFKDTLERMASGTGANAMAARRFMAGGGLDALGSRAYGASEQDAIDNRLINPTDRLISLLDVTSPAARRAEAEAMMSNEAWSLMDSTGASGMSDPKAVRRFFSAVQAAGYDPERANLSDVAKEVFNIVDNEEMATKIGDQLGALRNADAKWKRAQDAAGRLRQGDSSLAEFEKAQDTLLREAESRREVLQGEIERFQELLEDPSMTGVKEEMEKRAEEAAAAGTASTATTFKIDQLVLNGKLIGEDMDGGADAEATGGRGTTNRGATTV